MPKTLHCVTAFLACLWTSGFSAGADRDSQPPNIIYIMVDDLGYGDLRCFGQERIQTPRLDALAREGLRMTDHYAGHTVCRPSRLVLWTGKHVASTGLIGNRSRSLTGNETTVAKCLQEAGYATGGVGKWALGHVEDEAEIDNPGHPCHNGFDFWMGYMNQSNAHNFYPTHLWKNFEKVPLKGNVLLEDPQARGRVSKERVTYSHDVMTDEALDFIRRHRDRPFLLHVHWTIPHANNEGGRVTGDGMEVPDYGIYANQDWPNPEKGFAAMITRMDGDVGRMVDLLRQLELDDNTLLIFTSDNGPHKEGGHDADFFDSNGPLTGTKRSMHEGGIRVPMIAWWPGTIEQGRTSDHPSAFCDFLPTACEIAGADAPKEIDGLSYLPTLLDRPEDQAQHSHLFWASQEGDTDIGIRRGDWKLVRYRKPKKAKSDEPDWRLYRLDVDISEKHDLAYDFPEVVADIQQLAEDDLRRVAPLLSNRSR
ncbi:MAG: arylsulfatase [Planctomycetota bacterium]